MCNVNLLQRDILGNRFAHNFVAKQTLDFQAYCVIIESISECVSPLELFSLLAELGQGFSQ